MEKSSKFWWDNASDNETRCIDTWMRRIKFVRHIEVHALVMFVLDIYIYIYICIQGQTREFCSGITNLLQ